VLSPFCGSIGIAVIPMKTDKEVDDCFGVSNGQACRASTRTAESTTTQSPTLFQPCKESIASASTIFCQRLAHQPYRVSNKYNENWLNSSNVADI
jgi:hypothetical protein